MSFLDETLNLNICITGPNPLLKISIMCRKLNEMVGIAQLVKQKTENSRVIGSNLVQK